MNNADAPQERTGSAQDGRRLRSERSRARILDAVAEALADPDVDLTPAGIAARAGVSVSTIARHFGDREGLVAAMRDRIQTLLLPILSEGPFEGELRARIRELLRRRTAMFEIVAPLYRSRWLRSWLSRRTASRFSPRFSPSRAGATCARSRRSTPSVPRRCWSRVRSRCWSPAASRGERGCLLAREEG
jgi:AcrR family transcriptional regulator